jgi:DNA-binding transcriptional ArsR family regulator
MTKYYGFDRETTDALFRALADGTRRAMVERLARGPASVSDLAEPFGITLPTAMQHLGILEEAGITRSQKIGRVRTFQLVPDALGPVAAWATRQRTPAERRADRLVDHLADHP